MGYRLKPNLSIRRETRRVAQERVDRALDRFAELDAAEPSEIAAAILEIRKECKKLRALAHVAEPGLGTHALQLDRAARKAARQLSEFRDDQAALAAFDNLTHATGQADPEIQRIRAVLDNSTHHATDVIRAGDPRIEKARTLLADVRPSIARWKAPKDFAFLATGLGRTYDKGRRLLENADEHPTEVHFHEWRTGVKRLGYQMRLVGMAAPSVLQPLTASLRELSHLLGDDHDLTMLVDRLESNPDRYGEPDAVGRIVGLARARQNELRAHALRLGATVYAEKPDAFVLRMSTYWRIASSIGPERTPPSRDRLGPERLGT